MGNIQVNSIKDNAPLIDIANTPPPKDFIVVKNTVDSKYYMSTGVEWKLVEELNKD
ncbi:hypothetical protein QKU48_gp0053 [Fadolivirus algeromassiliense]|jgi:hypothetical protein|uniref:Uncharacterized protein n=1 Tax=Fadolivirus FV1/VV64 TaxID=3070911 RepID=A0A7D3UTI0_9VIRU|nr:hypothetical protein QKU48_gp0053 [Fadolivirus algeromassiliense]QKF93511.1 hypothetical protein Fadolivirus_1_53 [Fadolivirus FV1/VV64]